MVSSAVAVLALAVGAGTAGAVITSSGPVSTSGVVSGCYTTRAVHGSHAVVLQDAGTKCPRGTTAITWNQAGQAGVPGTGSKIDSGILTVTAQSNGTGMGGSSGSTVTGCTLADTGGPNVLTASVATTGGGGLTTGSCAVAAVGVTAFVPLVTPIFQAGSQAGLPSVTVAGPDLEVGTGGTFAFALIPVG